MEFEKIFAKLFINKTFKLKGTVLLKVEKEEIFYITFFSGMN